MNRGLAVFAGATALAAFAVAARYRPSPPGSPGEQVVDDGSPASLIRRGDEPVVERDASLMGTDVHILVLTEDRDGAERAIDEALAEIRRIEDLMTDWRDDSPLSAINLAAGAAPVKTSREIVDLLLESVRASDLTGGKFDVTYAGAGRLWDFAAPNPSLPDPEAVRAGAARVDYRRMRIDAEALTVFLPEAGMRIGLGGIAKGYAVDRAARILRDRGFRDFAVKAGGDMIVRGRREGRLWWVGVRHPRRRGENVAILPVSNVAISTSGDYERFFEIDGKRYCHILDPDTGYPVDHCQGVTILAKTSTWADALSTGVFVLGPERGMDLIESLPDVEGMILDALGEIHVSSGLRGEPPGEPR